MDLLNPINLSVNTEYALITIESDDGESCWLDISSNRDRMKGCGIQFDIKHLDELIEKLQVAQRTLKALRA